MGSATHLLYFTKRAIAGSVMRRKKYRHELNINWHHQNDEFVVMVNADFIRKKIENEIEREK